MMARLRKIEKLNPKNMNINHYLNRLEQYFVANAIEADSSTSHRRRTILISVIGGKTYDIFPDLCLPDSFSSKSYAALRNILKGLVISEDTVSILVYKRKTPAFPILLLTFNVSLLHATLAPI